MILPLEKYKDTPKFYIAKQFKITAADQVIDFEFCLPPKYKALCGIIVSTSIYSELNTLQLSINQKEILPENTPVQLFMNNPYANFMDRIYPYINEPIERSTIQIKYANLDTYFYPSFTPFFPFYLEIIFVCANEYVPQTEQYIIQTHKIDVTAAGNYKQTFATFSKYNKLVAFSILTEERSDSDNTIRNSIGIKVDNTQIIEDNTHFAVFKSNDKFTSVNQRFTDYLLKLNNSIVTVNYNDVGSFSVVGNYSLFINLILSK